MARVMSAIGWVGAVLFMAVPILATFAILAVLFLTAFYGP